MKIHKLILKNINSLKGENSIDFKKNFDNSIFLITGDTGAGKSTILDAICCALYNETPRLKDARNLLTKHTAQANITLEYEVKNSLYRSSWSIQRAYKKVSGELAKAPKMEIAKFDEVKGEFEILETKISLIPKIVQGITGLDFSQFQKSMLLSQGNFDAFLKASVNERADLLEKMTGTEIYTKIGMKTFEVYKAKKQDIDNLKLKLGEITVLESDELKECEKLSKELKKENEKLSKEQKNNNLLIENINKKETLLNDIKNYIKVLDESKLKQKEFEKDEKEIAKELSIFQSKHDSFMIDYKKELEIIDETTILDSDIANGLKNEKLISNDIKRLEKDSEDLTKTKELKNKEIESLKTQNLESTNYLANNLDEVLVDDFTILSFRIDEYLKLKIAQNKELNFKSELESSLKESKIVLETEKITHKNYVEKLEYLKSKTIVLKYEEDRETLKNDEPCPLCGSSSHPYKDDSSLVNVKQEIQLEQIQLIEDISKIEKKINSLESSLVKNHLNLESLDEKLNTLKTDINLISLELKPFTIKYDFNLDEDLKNVQMKLKTRFESYKIHKEKVENFNKQLISFEHNLEIINTKISVNNTQNLTELDKLKNISEITKKLSEKRDKLYGKKDTVAEKTKLEDSKSKLEQGFQKQKEQQQKVQTELESIKVKISEFNNFLDEKTKSLESLQSKYSVEDKEKFLKISDELGFKLEDINRQYGQLTQKLNENSLKLESSKKYILELENKQKQVKPYEILNDFIGNADGKKFKRFAQNLTLGHLLSLANKHLKTLNERYFLVKDKTKDLEILVVDTFLGDSKRSVNSLSGGEGFLVSLSLALGLSDMVSSKVSIESLFLDEGFGTLDSKTLNDALITLSKLQDSGKMIGIISHVEALKNSISLQIEVKKGSGGVGSINIK